MPTFQTATCGTIGLNLYELDMPYQKPRVNSWIHRQVRLEDLSVRLDEGSLGRLVQTCTLAAAPGWWVWNGGNVRWLREKDGTIPWAE